MDGRLRDSPLPLNARQGVAESVDFIPGRDVHSDRLGYVLIHRCRAPQDSPVPCGVGGECDGTHCEYGQKTPHHAGWLHKRHAHGMITIPIATPPQIATAGRSKKTAAPRTLDA